MKTSKYLLYFVLGTFVLALASCEPKKLHEEDLLLSNSQVAEIIKDGKLYNINDFVDKYMDPVKGNFASDSTHYRTRSNNSKHPDIWLFTIDTLPTNGPGIYLRGRVATEDYAGNYYKSIVIQQMTDWNTGAIFDAKEQQTLRISVDMGSVGGLYQLGQEIIIRCNGLAIGRYANQPQLAIPVYNNKTTAMNADKKVGWEPGRIPSATFRNAVHLIGKPDPNALVYYKPSSLADLYTTIDQSPAIDLTGMAKVRRQDGMLVSLENVWFNGQYSNYGDLVDCVAGDPDPGDGNSHSEINVFAPSTGNIGFPQSRVLTDASGSVLLCSSSEYCKYAHFYLPGADKNGVTNCKNFKGSVSGILGWYMDDADDLDLNNKEYKLKWAITPRGIPGFGIPDIQMKDADGLPWEPVEYNPHEQ